MTEPAVTRTSPGLDRWAKIIGIVTGSANMTIGLLNLLSGPFGQKLPWSPLIGWAAWGVLLAVLILCIVVSKAVRDLAGNFVRDWRVWLTICIILLAISVGLHNEYARAEVETSDVKTQKATVDAQLVAQSTKIPKLENQVSDGATAIVGCTANGVTQAASLAGCQGTSVARSTALAQAQAASTAQAASVSNTKATVAAQATALAAIQAGGTKLNGTPQPCRFDALVTELVAVPPGAPEVMPGQRILKIWNIENSGTCSWGGETAWVFASNGNTLIVDSPRWHLNGVLPGQSIKVEELMTAPGRTGVYTGTWQMVSDGGTVFGNGFSIRVTIREEPVSPVPLSDCKPNVQFVSDGSYSDKTGVPQIAAGTHFRKAWVFLNRISGCPLTEGYALVPVGGDDLRAVAQPLQPTAPGELLYVIVEMVAPEKPDTYESYWQLQDPHGNRFGQQVYVTIKVP